MDSIKSKAEKKERWVRGTVISQEGAMVNVNMGNTILRVNQSKVRRDHDEWHDVALLILCHKSLRMTIIIQKLILLKRTMENKISGFISLENVMLLRYSAVKLV